MYFSSLEMADEWNEIESVGKSLGPTITNSQNGNDAPNDAGEKKSTGKRIQQDGKLENNDGKLNNSGEKKTSKNIKPKNENKTNRGSRGGQHRSNFNESRRSRNSDDDSKSNTSNKDSKDNKEHYSSREGKNYNNDRQHSNNNRGGGRGGYTGNRGGNHNSDNYRSDRNNERDDKRTDTYQRRDGPRNDREYQGGYRNNDNRDNRDRRNHDGNRSFNNDRDRRNNDGHSSDRNHESNHNKFGRNNHRNNENDKSFDNEDKNNHEHGDRENRNHEQRTSERRGRGGFSGGRGGILKNITKPREAPYIPPEPTNDEGEMFGSGISSGINFDKYNKIPINVSGENAPPAMESFEKSGLSELLLNNITKSGYKTPTPIQKAAIPIILAGRDLMGCAQTGSGKTAAFLLPIINCLLEEDLGYVDGQPRVLIVSPTRELSIQIFSETRKFAFNTALKTCIVYGGAASNDQSNKLDRGCHLLIATPGRLLDFVEKGKISFDNLRFLVLDEADRMLDMGFFGSIESMMNNSSMPDYKKRQTIMFSATFPKEIQVLAGQFLNQYIFLAVGIIGGACTDVEQKIFSVTRFEKKTKLMDILENDDPSGTMVFVETQRNADFLASFLSETKIPTTSIHGARTQQQREEALREFKSGRMKLLIATSVAARGLDIKNVAHVINYDLPKSIDEYVHRIGRTGRVGNCGRATSFYDPEEDLPIAYDLSKILSQADQKVPDFLEKIPKPTHDGPHHRRGGGHFTSRDVRKGANNRFEKIENKKNDSGEILTADEPEENW